MGPEVGAGVCAAEGEVVGVGVGAEKEGILDG